MTKSELITRLSDAFPYLHRSAVSRVVEQIFEEISRALENGNRVEIRGFGSFSVKHRAPRIGRNPRTGEEVSVSERHLPAFKVGRELRMRLNHPDP